MHWRSRALACLVIVVGLIVVATLGLDASALLTDSATVPENSFTTTNAFP